MLQPDLNQLHLSLLQVPLDGRDNGPVVATVFEDPTIDASDTKLLNSEARQLTISGTGFNADVWPILDFDPPLDSKNIHIDVRGWQRCCSCNIVCSQRNCHRVW